MGLAPAPLNLWGFAWVALFPLWRQVIQPRQSLRQILLHSGLWGVAYHGFCLSWLGGLHPLTWLGIPEFASLAIVCSCWGLVTAWGTVFVLLWGLGIWGYQRWSLRFGLVQHPYLNAGLRLLVGTALWCALESWRNHGPLDWTPLGFTQSPGNLAILYLGQWSGPLMVSAAIASINGGWAESFNLGASCSLQSAAPARSTVFPVMHRASATAMGLTLVMLLVMHGVGSAIGQPKSSPQPPSAFSHPSSGENAINVGIIQGNIPTREKLTVAGVEKAKTHYLAGYTQLADQGVDLVITPEAALPFRWHPRQSLAEQVLETIRDRQVPMLLGTFMAQSGQTTQSLIALTAQGQILSQYDKVKLVPLGEYIPGEAWLGGWLHRLSTMTGSLSPGSHNQRFLTPVGPAAAGICFDSAFSSVLRSQVAAGGEFIVIASNLDPYSTVLMAQVHAHDVMRAIETDRDLVRATNTGFSGAITHQGQTLWRSQSQVYEVQSVTIARRKTQTLYVRWGDWITPTLGWLSLATMAAYTLTPTPIRLKSKSSAGVGVSPK